MDSTIAEKLQQAEAKIAQSELQYQRISANIADAYDEAEAKGATMPAAQNSANLADTIDSISTGTPAVKEKDVNFIDWDGTILYSYTEEEVMALTELPPLPVKAGYTYQGWNWTLEQIKANCQPMFVGALHVPTGGATRFTFDLMPGDNKTVSFQFTAVDGLALSVDWGDGTSQVVTSSPAQHTYASSIEDCEVLINSNQNFVLSKIGTSTLKLKSVEFGSNIRNTNTYFFENYYFLEAVSFPSGFPLIKDYSLQYCTSLKCVIIPHDMEARYLYEKTFYGCISLKYVSLPGSNLLGITKSCFANCRLIECIALPDGLRNLRTYVFEKVSFLSEIIIPSTCLLDYDYIFLNCSLLRIIDLSSKTSVPVLGTGVFEGIASDYVIYVKNQTMLDAFSAATNWSAHASHMQIGGKYAD